MMLNWSDELVRAENEYRRQRLHKLASHRTGTGQRHAAWWPWTHRGLRR